MISSSVNPKSGFAALIASFTACFSSLVNASFFATGTFVVGSLIVMPCSGATVTVAFTSSFEPSLYFTTTGISTSCPALSAAGVYLISPVAGSICAPSGAPSPSANFVSAGIDAGCPALSVKFGAEIVVCLPTSASASVYLGSTLSVVFSVLVSSQTA